MAQNAFLPYLIVGLLIFILGVIAMFTTNPWMTRAALMFLEYNKMVIGNANSAITEGMK